MVPPSLNGVYLDGNSQVLWEDGDRVFCRGWRLGDDGNPSAVLVVLPAAERPSPSSLDRLAHEYGLKDELDGGVGGAVTGAGARRRSGPDDRDWVRQGARDARRQKRDYGAEFGIVLPDRTVRYLEATAHFVFSADGELVEIVGTHVDLTERKRAQEEHQRLRQLEADLAHMNRLRMMGELAASLIHEITQPIASARNNARAALNFLDRSPPRSGKRSAVLWAMLIEPETSSTGSVITSRRRLREGGLLISTRRSTR